MSFWTSFAKNVLLKVLSDNNPSREADSEERRRCPQCGRMVPVESLQDGRCVVCRIEQEREQDRQDRHGHDSRSHRTDTTESTSNKLEDAYRTLGCTVSDSNAEIKRKFRVLIKECHVDSLPKDLPEYLVKAANKRFVEVQEAYDLIRDARKMA